MTAIWIILGAIVGGAGMLFLLTHNLPNILMNMLKNIDGPPATKERKWQR